MKNNQPVTQREVPFPKGKYVVSQTDLKGIIRDANDTFVELSGFTREELMGSSHNIVRHPDVPPAIFADMWNNLKAGLPWRAVVKNRCKNGDHYWVDAQVVPIIRNGEITGYMSVRREPTRQQIQEAEALYAEVRQTGKFNSVKRHPIKLATLLYAMSGFSIFMFLQNNIVMWLDLPEIWDRITGILGLLALFPIPFLLYRKFIRPLRDIQQNILRLTEGDLASRYPTCAPDEMGMISNAFLTMQTQWLVSIDHIHDAIEKSQHNMTVVAQQVETIDRQINSQHDKVASVAAATEEFSQAVAEVANTAADTAHAAEKSEQLVSTSQAVVQDGMSAAEQVVEGVKQSHVSIAELNTAVSKIGDITQAIKDIADQTNLLALNAAIEAARAGEQGRGFAVVADEVRKLAERTTGSTQEIADMVSGIQRMATVVVSTMDSAAEAVECSSSKMRESVEGLNRVTEASKQTAEMAEVIATASDQQRIAGLDVARNMEQIAQLSEQNQRNLEDLLGALQHMRHATAEIDDAVGAFRLFPASSR